MKNHYAKNPLTFDIAYVTDGLPLTKIAICCVVTVAPDNEMLEGPPLNLTAIPGLLIWPVIITLVQYFALSLVVLIKVITYTFVG